MYSLRANGEWGVPHELRTSPPYCCSALLFSTGYNSKARPLLYLLLVRDNTPLPCAALWMYSIVYSIVNSSEY